METVVCTLAPECAAWLIQSGQATEHEIKEQELQGETTLRKYYKQYCRKAVLIELTIADIPDYTLAQLESCRNDRMLRSKICNDYLVGDKIDDTMSIEQVIAMFISDIQSCSLADITPQQVRYHHTPKLPYPPFATII